ncbi:MAG: PAS domain S-box protein [Bacteroidota bacterium]
MQSAPFPANENDRLGALGSYQILDTLSEEEYDALTRLAAQICGTRIALISLIDENRQWFKSKVGLDISEIPRELAFCAHTINLPNEPFIIEDARLDDRFKDNPIVNGDPNVVFYAGIPLVNQDDFPLGTLCVIDNQPKKLSEEQIDGLKTLSRSVISLLELRRKNASLEKEKDVFLDSLEFNNPFFIITDFTGSIQHFGSKLLNCLPSLEKNKSVFNVINFLTPFKWKDWINQEKTPTLRLFFFESLDGQQRFKFSVKRIEENILLSAVPVVNANFHLSTYNLTLNDFAKHDYIAEYLFLQQTTDRSLVDAKNLLSKTQQRNKELEEAQTKIDILARFPGENPNPIVRLDLDLKVSYKNRASEKTFMSDFGISDYGLEDEELKVNIDLLVKQGQDVLKLVLNRNNRHYNMSIRHVREYDYINIYATDITNYIYQVEQKERELIAANKRIEEQKQFYEFVLNAIPSDIAVFSTGHKYVFINPQGIKNKEIREYMIGKDDYDYCNFKGIPTDLADNRRAVFNEVMRTGEFRDWFDDLTDADGNRKVIYRRIGPLKDETGVIRYVVGYGVEVTDTKLAEEKLIESNKKLVLLENFLNKTTDAIQVSDEKGNMVFINETASKRLGIDQKEIQKHHVSEFEKYFSDEKVWENHLAFLRENKIFNVESVNVNQTTGEEIDVEVNVVYEEIDGAGYLIAAARDISQRRKSEEEIRRLSLVAKNTTNGVLILDKNRKIIWANEAIVNRSEYSVNELIGQSPKVFQFEGTNQETIERIYNSLVKVEPLQEEVLHSTKSGSLYWISLNIQPIFDANGQLEGFIAIELDITERKNFEETIAAQNKDLKEITDALDQSALVSIADSNGLIIRANNKFCAVSGYTEQELIGQNHNIVNSRYHDAAFWSEMWTTIRQGKIWRAEVCNKKKNGELYWVDSIIYPVFDLNGKIRHFLSIRHEITDRKLAEEELARKAELQRLLVKISSDYINIPLNAVEASMNKSMAEIGTFVKVDRVYVFDYNYEKETTSNLYEWCSEGIEPQIEYLQNLPFSEVPFWVETHSRGESIVVPNVFELPPSSFRELIEVQGIQSLVAIPMMDGKNCIGFVGFDAVKGLRSFSKEERGLLELYAQMLVNVSQRTDYMKQIQQAKNDIEEINRGLELQVQEKTKTNLELAKSISDQEKMVTIGEIASGIAHDLNTPLGAIKSGAENIRYTLEALFHDTIYKCNPKQIELACERASKTEIELFVGGLQQRKETEMYRKYLGENFTNISAEQIEMLALGFVKNRVNIQDSQLIAEIVNSTNSKEFLELIYHIQMTRNFVDTILSSGERASQVINDLRSFIRDKKSSDKAEINIQQNIATVLNIFNYELKRNTDVQFLVDPNLTIIGIDIRLFQLWSNLIKNAVESMTEIEQRGLLRIVSSQTDKHILVSVENNGPKIPQEIQDRIFEKFFTTKASKNGSGLGLSIVSSVIQEHNAELELFSNDLVTKFIVKFKK